jgi:hypothetical protein
VDERCNAKEVIRCVKAETEEKTEEKTTKKKRKKQRKRNKRRRKTKRKRNAAPKTHNVRVKKEAERKQEK